MNAFLSGNTNIRPEHLRMSRFSPRKQISINARSSAARVRASAQLIECGLTSETNSTHSAR